MDVRVEYSDSFPINQFNQKDFYVLEAGVLDGFFLYPNSGALEIGNSHAVMAYETDDGNSYATIPDSHSGNGVLLKVILSNAEAPLNPVNVFGSGAFSTTLAFNYSHARTVGIANVYLGVHYDSGGEAKSYIFIDDGSDGTTSDSNWVDVPLLTVSSELTTSAIDSFLSAYYGGSTVNEILQPIRVTTNVLSTYTAAQYNQIIERLRLLAQAKLRASGNSKYISYDDGGGSGAQVYECIVIGQIFVTDAFAAGANFVDSWDNTDLGTDARNYYNAVGTYAYILHNDVNYGSYQKALLDLQTQILNMNITGLYSGLATPKPKSVGFDELSRDDLYYYVAPSTSIISIDSDREKRDLFVMPERSYVSGTTDTHMIKRYMIPTRALYDSSGTYIKYNCLNFDFNIHRVNLATVTDGVRYLRWALKAYLWFPNTTSAPYGQLSSQQIYLSAGDPYRDGVSVPAPRFPMLGTYKTKQLASFASTSVAIHRHSQITGGFRSRFLNTTNMALFQTYPEKPDNISDTLDITTHKHTTYYADGLELYGMSEYVVLILALAPSHTYVSGEWEVNRINLFLSDADDLGDNEGHGWGLRIAGL